MSAPTIRVSIGDIRRVAAYADGRPRHRLEWTLLIPDGTKEAKTLTHTDPDVLFIFRSELLKATGKKFDRVTGLPPGLQRPTAEHSVQDAAGRPILADVAQRLDERWDQPNRHGEHKGHTVKGLLNEAISVCMVLLREDAPDLDLAGRKSARDWLRRQFIPPRVQQRAADADAKKLEAARAGGPKDKQQKYRWRRADERAVQQAAQRAKGDNSWAAFFDRYALRWYDLDAQAMRAAIAALRLEVSGETNELQTSTKHFVALNELMRWGVVEGKVAANPIDSLKKWERPSTTTKIRRVDKRQVPGMDYLVQILDTCRQFGLDGDPMALRVLVLIAILALAGLRPSEGRALHVEDFTLPERGWGNLTFGRRTTSPGRMFTDDGEPDEHGSLKWRDCDDLRDVPLPPMLVAIVRRHIRDFDLSEEDYIACDQNGNQLETADIYKVWHRVRAAVFADAGVKKFRSLQLKDLRHTRASLLLAARAVPAGPRHHRAAQDVREHRQGRRQPVQRPDRPLPRRARPTGVRRRHTAVGRERGRSTHAAAGHRHRHRPQRPSHARRRLGTHRCSCTRQGPHRRPSACRFSSGSQTRARWRRQRSGVGADRR
jgi:integrase